MATGDFIKGEVLTLNSKPIQPSLSTVSLTTDSTHNLELKILT